jgi:hypothetical protein
LDISLEYAIFNEAYKAALTQLREDLKVRSWHLKQVFERDGLTKQVIDKANKEEQYIKNIIGYITSSEHVISCLISHLIDKKQIQIDWHAEWLEECNNHQRFVQMMLMKYTKLQKNGKGAT